MSKSKKRFKFRQLVNQRNEQNNTKFNRNRFVKQRNGRKKERYILKRFRNFFNRIFRRKKYNY